MEPATHVAAQAAHPQNESAGRARFEAGREAFSEGRFAAALHEFKQAYELTQRPVLLYDIGASADRLRHDREALEAFELYLVKVPTPPNLAEIQGRIAVLRETVSRQTASAPANSVPSSSPADQSAHKAETEPKLIEAQPSPASGEITAAPAAAVLPASASAAHSPKSAAPTPAEVARAAPRDGSPPSLAPWIVIGVSAGAMVAGGVLLAVAATRMYKVEHAPKGTTLDQIRGAHDSVPALSIAGFVSLGVGAAGAAAGLTWKLLPDKDTKTGARSGTTASLRLVPGGASLSGKF